MTDDLKFKFNFDEDCKDCMKNREELKRFTDTPLIIWDDKITEEDLKDDK